MTTAQKPRTLTRQVSQLGEVRFDGAVWVDAIYADVQAWARRARITEDAPPTVVEG